VRSERAVTLNLVALYKALGGGWDTDKPQHLAGAGVGKAAATAEQTRR
jgi:outer membrane protein TolC